MAIRPFAEAVLAHGTTGIMTDLHEVGVVSGLEGIEAILKEACDRAKAIYKRAGIELPDRFPVVKV